MPDEGIQPPSDSMTIVIHLPQHVDKINAVLHALGREWPHATFTDGFARVDIPADG